MKRVRISANWDSSENILNRLLSQFKTPDIDLSKVNFVFDDSYDIGVFFNYINLQIDKSKQYYVFPHEPIWSGSHQKSFPSNATVYGFDKEKYIGNCIETVSHTFYGGRGPWVDKLEIWNYNHLINNKFEKIKNISSCLTDLNYDYGLYKKRYNLLKNLLPLQFIDFFGCSSQNLINTLTSPLKIDSVRPYKFTLCIENDYHKNWLTERFYDAILTDCIPIYYGCSNIKEIYPEDGYILLDNIEDVNYVREVLNNINNNAEELYRQKLPYARQIKEKYFKDYNLLKIISQL